MGEGVKDRFAEVVERILDTHTKKANDYGSSGDVYGNFRPSEKFGVPAWIGALVRQGDKIARIQSFIMKGKLLNESVEDSLLDNAVYAIISYCLYLDAQEKGAGEVDDRVLEETQLDHSILSTSSSGKLIMRSQGNSKKSRR